MSVIEELSITFAWEKKVSRRSPNLSVKCSNYSHDTPIILCRLTQSSVMDDKVKQKAPKGVNARRAKADKTDRISKLHLQFLDFCE
jgi:hypothetical protein